MHTFLKFLKFIQNYNTFFFNFLAYQNSQPHHKMTNHQQIHLQPITIHLAT